jgi:transposase
LEVVRQLFKKLVPVKELCRRLKISRQTAYKWRERYRRAGLRGLKDQTRRTRGQSGRPSPLWLQRVRRERLRHRTWGARKLRHTLQKRFGAGGPSVAAITRWLNSWGLAAGRPRRRRGPELFRKPLRPARRCHEIWTVDYKGWYRTGNGQRVEPLTVRDLFSRYILQIKLFPRQSLTRTTMAPPSAEGVRRG